MPDNKDKSLFADIVFDKTKLTLGLICILLIGGGLTYHLTEGQKYQKQTLQIREIELPMEIAIREVEVSIWEVSTAILSYVGTPSPGSLEEYKKQKKDVDEFMGKYDALASSPKEKEMINKFNAGWELVLGTADSLVKLKDQSKELEAEAWNIVNEADDIIDFKIQAGFVSGLADLIEKEKAIREVEVSIWEANNAVNYFVASQRPIAEKELQKQLDDVKNFMNKYEKLRLSTAEKGFVVQFKSSWDLAVKKMLELMQMMRTLEDNRVKFIGAIHSIDDIVDFEIQAHLKERLNTGTK